MISTSFEYTKFNFPVGEIQLQITSPLIAGDKVDILWEFESNEEIIEFLLLVDAIKRMGAILQTVYLPYIPFSRQDRVNEKGEAFSLKVFADLLNSCGAQTVQVQDPHSEVSSALINNIRVIPQEELMKWNLRNYHDYHLIASDAGSLKKIYKVAAMNNPLDVIECSKHRDLKTGKITNTVVHADDLQGKTCIICDDICDGGATYVHLAKELKQKNAGKIVLMITHGFFTRGLEVFEDIDEIYSRKGKIK